MQPEPTRRAPVAAKATPSPPSAETPLHSRRTRQELALLFWLEAACAAPEPRTPTPADCASAPLSSTGASVTTSVVVTAKRKSTESRAPPPPPLEGPAEQHPRHGGAPTEHAPSLKALIAAGEAAAAASSAPPEQALTAVPSSPPGEVEGGGDGGGLARAAVPPDNHRTVSSSPPPQLVGDRGPRRRLVVADALPLFGALLGGRLGPVAVDVQLQGHTRLLRHPQQFEAALQAYERQSAGELREALSGVQPFFLLCNGGGADLRWTPLGASEGGMHDDGHPQPALGPEAPPASLVLYTMHPAKDYPILPLLAQLLRAPQVTKLLLHSRLLYRLLFLFLGTDRVDLCSVVDLPTWTALGQQLRPSLATLFHLPTEGVERLSQVSAALPSEAQQLLDEETQSIAQEPLQEQPSLDKAWHVRNDDDSESGSVEEGRIDSSSGADDTEDGGEMGRDVGGTSQMGVAEDEPIDAVQLLHRIQPLAEQPLNGNNGSGSGAATLRSGSAARTAGVKRRLLRSHQPYRRHRQDSGPPPSSASYADTSALADICYGLKAVTLFFTHVLARLLDLVDPGATGAAASLLGIAALPQATARCGSVALASPTSAVRYRLSPSELCALRTYADFLCELMAYHGVFVNDAAMHEMLRMLDVQMATIEDLGRRVAAALLTNREATAFGAAPREAKCLEWSIETVHECLAWLTGAATPSETPRALDVNYLRLLEAQARSSIDARAAELRLGCQLVCAWIAYQDRAAAKARLQDVFRKVSDRLHVRVLEHPRAAPTSSCATASGASGAPAPQVCYSIHPDWVLHNTSTGRIFSALPNVQNLPRQSPRTTFPIHALSTTQSSSDSRCGDESLHPSGYVGPPAVEDVDRWLSLAEAGAADQESPAPLLFPEHPQWTLRHLYRAPPGCVLVSFDFNQLELRLLAHLSGDAALQEHLSANVDVLACVTASVLRLPSIDRVHPQQRQAIKVVVYGLLYGMGPDSMDLRIRKISEDFAAEKQQQQQSGEGKAASTAPTPISARDLLKRFYHVYPRIERYLRETRQEALHSFAVETLSGRKSLVAETDANRRKQRAVAQAVQGGAADVLHSAMRAVHQQRHSLLPYLPAAPLALVMTIHDELVYAVPRVAVEEVVRGVQRILEDQARQLRLTVPLPVSVRVGHSFGELTEFHAARVEAWGLGG
ncbi:hypothetical protein LSCM1_05037 [Leishmania martiniquensis]|uniref:DNA-directed DNA polymerase family A palm domain-containing protein n=1 Tax=Leishmania martiniquensis TaxID=1580590 RepID=A0A836KJ42_9TRYP|nr:hypothetical protein LSCM1_05037 [Leishmania martiniquensis]